MVKVNILLVSMLVCMLVWNMLNRFMYVKMNSMDV